MFFRNLELSTHATDSLNAVDSASIQIKDLAQQHSNQAWQTYLTLYKTFLGFLMISMPLFANAECTEDLGLNGTITIDTCDRNKEKCISADQAVYEYANNIADRDEILLLILNSSPWRFYDEKMRILSVDEVATMIRPMMKKSVKSVSLMSSWSGHSPVKGAKSLSDRLSKQLDGTPVKGVSGFLWLSQNGKYRTTKQQFTVRRSGPYEIAQGTDVICNGFTRRRLAC